MKTSIKAWLINGRTNEHYYLINVYKSQQNLLRNFLSRGYCLRTYLDFQDLIIEILCLKHRNIVGYMNQYKKNRRIISHKKLVIKNLKLNMFEMDVRTFW